MEDALCTSPAHARIISAHCIHECVGGACLTTLFGGAVFCSRPSYSFEDFEADSWVVIPFFTHTFSLSARSPSFGFLSITRGRNSIHPFTGSRNIWAFSSAVGWSSRSIVWGYPRTPEPRGWLGICWPSCLFWRLRKFSSRPLFFSYSIPFGRNLRGVLLGYGLFISESVIWLTFASSGGNRFLDIWFYLHPASYFVVLGVWAVHLWSHAPNPKPKRAVHLEEQYQGIAVATSQRLREGRAYLAKVVRS